MAMILSTDELGFRSPEAMRRATAEEPRARAPAD
jgi:hypothetical protein